MHQEASYSKTDFCVFSSCHLHLQLALDCRLEWDMAGGSRSSVGIEFSMAGSQMREAGGVKGGVERGD